VSTGWPAVRDQCAEFGDSFDEWQDGAGRAILAKRADGLYAATVGGITLSIPRQVAKTFLVGRIVFALCVLFPDTRVIWTAHRTRTATNSFRALMGYARRKKVAPLVEHVRSANGEQEIAFKNGSIILFGAREHGFGRGFDEIDVAVFDEAQILSEKALDDIVPATNQARHPHSALLFFMGTPPRLTDNGESFTLRRAKALSGRATDGLYIEFSADEDADLDDREQWAKANPSFPIHTPEQAILRMRENLGDDESFRHEALGIWSELTKESILGRWPTLVGAAPERSDPVFALDIAPDHSTATISTAWLASDGSKWLQYADHRPGTEWVVSRWNELCDRYGGRILVEQSGTAAFLLPQLVDTESVSRRFYIDACATLDAEVAAGTVHHGNQPEMNAAVAAARWAESRVTGERVLVRKDPRVSPLVAGALALHGVVSARTSGGWMVGV
jgi:hypothetical protein